MLTMACLALLALGPAPPVDPDAKPTAERLLAIADYRQRRDDVAPTARAHFALAEWCATHGLADEAEAHYTIATRIDPKFVEAWTRLGYRRFEGQWRSEAEIARLRDERHDRQEAEARYRPWLVSWSEWLDRGGDLARALKFLDPVTDPRAVSSILGVFGRRQSGHQGLAVRMLGHIDSNEATLGLCVLAVEGLSPITRRNAGEALDHRDPRVYVGYLINRIREPVRFETLRGDGVDIAGELRIEEPSRIVDRVYEVPRTETISAPPSQTIARLDSSGLPALESVRYRVIPGSSPAENRAAAEARMGRDVRLIERENFGTDRANDRVLPLLRQATGRDFGTDRAQWTSWWTGQLGYDYRSQPPPAEPKPVVVQPIQIAAPRPATFQVISTPIILGRSRSCFAAGTLVRTETGPRPIEDLAVGDLVLSRDTTTGSFRYRPIVTTFRNPPASTLRVELDDDAILATGIHRFWRVGRGWTMARDLRPGDRISTVRGESRISAISADRVQPVFNLEVLDDADFFVGHRGALVHDNTLAPPTTHAFDAAGRRP